MKTEVLFLCLKLLQDKNTKGRGYEDKFYSRTHEHFLDVLGKFDLYCKPISHIYFFLHLNKKLNKQQPNWAVEWYCRLLLKYFVFVMAIKINMSVSRVMQGDTRPWMATTI